MSNVYILEPPTSGKVLLKTTVGDIELELWAKETPKAARNFIQLCMEGYYNNTIFHRVVKDFIVQGGDPNGDGTGGESIYGAPFKDEFHQRLKFVRRGLVAMANSEKDDNGSQFFFTMAATPELQNKHTIFGKVVGNTLFNMLKLQEGLIKGETPVYPHKILKSEVLHNPFPDIEPRVREETVVKEKKKKEKKKGVKNFKLLSFGEEAEEDEEESTKQNEKFSGKGKSTHDVLDDPKLSSQAAVEVTDGDKDGEDDSDTDHEQQLENIRKKLKSRHRKPTTSAAPKVILDIDEQFSDDEIDAKKQKFDEIKKEIENVKKEYQKNKLKKETLKTEQVKKEENKDQTIKDYQDEYNKYLDKKKNLPKKGAEREQFTLQLLDKFKQKLQALKQTTVEEEPEEEPEPEEIDNETSWMRHHLHFKDTEPVLAKDANKKDDDWFEIYDPRNPLNKRRRGEQAQKFSKDK